MLKIAVTKFKLLNRYDPALDAEDAVQNCFLRMTKYADKLDLPIRHTSKTML
jgi:DNA-directed RNA polymerase specialized sigma24 family protein